MASEDVPRDPVFSSDERGRLAQVLRFLTNVTDPRIARRAKNAGYTKREHAAGQALFLTASGNDRPFEHALARVDRRLESQLPAGLNARYGAVDEFENRWFKQADNLMHRFLEPDALTRLRTAFWLDLAQQPLGPGVVGSVSLFLTRLDALEKDTTPGVAEIFVALTERGLTSAERQRTRVIVDELGQLEESPDAETDEAEDAGIREADQKQRLAFEKLNRWYIDVAENLRGRLGYHDRVMLGISDARTGAPRDATEASTNLNEQ